jgi:hypothetical protein
MKTQAITTCSLLGVLLFFGTVLRADIIFRDTFGATDGTSLNGWTPQVGVGTWSANPAQQINDGSVDTSSDASMSLAFGTFTRNLGAGETLQLSFSTIAPANNNFLSNNGWAGISLHTDDGTNNEKCFLGDISGQDIHWGIVVKQPSESIRYTSITGAAQTVNFSYAYDTGAWSYQIGADILSGVTTTNIALSRVRIGADNFNITDINVSDITLSTIPEPSSGVLVLAVFAATLVRRRSRA